jgi:PAP2 superfamily
MIRAGIVGGCVLALGLTGSGSTPLSGAAADPIAEWNVAATSAAAASGMVPLRTPITLAILHLGMYDAVAAIAGDRQPYAVKLRVAAPASARAAAIEAGYRVLLAEFPTEHRALQSTYEKLLAGEPESEAGKHGSKIGAEIARRLLALRATDGRNDVVPYLNGSGPGVWVPTPPRSLPATTASLAKIKPFTMDSVAQFRPSGPPRLRSKKWAAEFNEVKTLGAKEDSARTAEQTATALFWEPLAGTVWPDTILRLAREQSLDLAASAHFQASAFAAFADGLIACWDAKFHFNSWRPITAIRTGAGDGNPLTAADPDWEPLGVTPNFPEYPSGHACVTAAVAYTIEDFFPHDVRIPARNIVTGEERLYRRAAEAVDEVVEARMLLGVHFRSADEDGAEMGRKIAHQIRRRWFGRIR